MHTRNYLNLATIILIVIYINLILPVSDYPDKPDKALQKGKNRPSFAECGVGRGILPDKTDLYCRGSGGHKFYFCSLYGSRVNN